MRDFFAAINEYPWTAFFVALFLMWLAEVVSGRLGGGKGGAK